MGTAEIESAIVSHPAVAEAAVIGLPDELRGNAIYGFAILMDGIEESEDLQKEIILHVREEMGPIAMPKVVKFVDNLPKTRSGKIMRRVLKAQEMGEDPGDLSTIEN